MAKKTNTYLTFKIEDETFALNVKNVHRIMDYQACTTVPLCANYMIGIINFKKKVLPIINTKIKLGYGHDTFSATAKIIVTELAHLKEKVFIGLLADTVIDVTDIKDKNIQVTSSIGNRLRSNYIKGLFQQQEHFTMILDLEKAFSDDELMIIRKQSKLSNKLTATV